MNRQPNTNCYELLSLVILVALQLLHDVGASTCFGLHRRPKLSCMLLLWMNYMALNRLLPTYTLDESGSAALCTF